MRSLCAGLYEIEPLSICMLSCCVSVNLTHTYSGAHFNPAVTCGAFIAGKLNVLAAPLYVLSQLAGSLCGSLLVLVRV